ncbi:HIT-like domain-containing protein [Pterulicium gracile]|uniref:HIT-like domain-containing protein n=1 Tax=Pterulicium gracile TaxID=1884261 RepID=A0A5C3QH95_9AGAR|nr:HIT-like domain-containing protein [Pterula gracilis]
MASSPAEIITRIPTQFAKAKQDGDLFFYPSTVHSHTEIGIDFEIRLCPALQKKPVLPTPQFEVPPVVSSTTEEKPVDPFMPPYNKGLYIGELKDELEDKEYVVLLNKFALVEGHALLISKKFESQSAPLSPGDLVMAYTLLRASRQQGRNIFAFYNCNDNSGASQPHKHLQFMPSPENDAPPIERVARSIRLESPDKPFTLASLPYAHYIFRLPPYLATQPLKSISDLEKLETVLAGAYITLLDLVISLLRHTDHESSSDAQTRGAAATRPSYNMIMTTEHIHMIPRLKESYSLSTSGPASDVNSLGFAGMLMVKSEEQLAHVKKESVARILTGVGCKPGEWDDMATGVVLDD